MVRATRSGSTLHGIPVGILMLDTQFQRLPGDIGNALTWDFPVLYKVVTGATQDRVFTEGLDGLLAPFVDGCTELAALGVSGIITSCGYLAPLQSDISDRSPVPVVTSALMQIPMVQALIGTLRRVGVITIDAASLTDDHLPDRMTLNDVRVSGMPDDGIIRRDLRNNRQAVDAAAQEAELCRVGLALQSANPDLGAIVVECTNLAPHSKALSRATGLPVFDIVTLVNWFHASLRPRSWPAE